MAKDAYYFLIPLILITIGLFILSWDYAAVLMLCLAAFVAFFFRDPERRIPPHPDEIVSPADGKIIRIREDEQGTSISIFLSILDVHINRAPLDGMIVRREYRPGRFKLAWDDRASVENEQVLMTIRGRHELSFSLVAGILARRIVLWKDEGEPVKKGDRIGLIRFGSRVDIFFPPECSIVVREGDRVYGGSSIIADWRESPEAKKEGSSGSGS